MSTENSPTRCNVPAEPERPRYGGPAGERREVDVEALLNAQQPERTRLLVLASAWWTLAQMETTGLSFKEFLDLALRSPEKGASLWDEMTDRLNNMAVDALGVHPEAVLTPEARELIEALVGTMGRQRRSRSETEKE